MCSGSKKSFETPRGAQQHLVERHCVAEREVLEVLDAEAILAGANLGHQLVAGDVEAMRAHLHLGEERGLGSWIRRIRRVGLRGGGRDRQRHDGARK